MASRLSWCTASRTVRCWPRSTVSRGTCTRCWWRVCGRPWASAPALSTSRFALMAGTQSTARLSIRGLPSEGNRLAVCHHRRHAIATQIAKTCNPWFFHLPLNQEDELPSYAFPFSPAEIERGQVFEFKLNHVVQVAHPTELVRTVFVEAREAANALGQRSLPSRAFQERRSFLDHTGPFVQRPGRVRTLCGCPAVAA